MNTSNQHLPVDIVFHPSWWHAHAGIIFDEDFFYHPKKRVESERKMEQVLYERFGKYGLGEHRNDDLPVIGAVHNAAGYLISEMLGCEVRYNEDAPPDVIPAECESPGVRSGFSLRKRGVQAVLKALRRTEEAIRVFDR